MTLKTTRLAPGRYTTEINEQVCTLAQITPGSWVAWTSSRQKPIAQASTKKELVSRLEIVARTTRDRTKSASHKIARRSELTKGTELSLVPRSVPGVRGRVKFLGYTKTNSGAEWLDVVDSNGRSRAVDPAKVKTVHRDRKML